MRGRVLQSRKTDPNGSSCFLAFKCRIARPDPMILHDPPRSSSSRHADRPACGELSDRHHVKSVTGMGEIRTQGLIRREIRGLAWGSAHRLCITDA